MHCEELPEKGTAYLRKEEILLLCFQNVPPPAYGLVQTKCKQHVEN